MEDILYKRLSDETIGTCLEVHKLMGSNPSEKFMKPVSKKNSSSEVITQTDKNGSIFFQMKINSASFGDFGAIRWENYFVFKVREYFFV